MSKNSGHEKAPVLAGAEALDNVNRSRKNVEMNDSTAITPDNLPVISHAGGRVVTTALLARLYGTDDHNIIKNYTSNDGRFVVGKHFHKLEGIELRDFKDKVTDGDVVNKRAKHLILWTERGAARHAKMLDTDKAWEVFEKLEDSYFQIKGQGGSSFPVPVQTLIGTVIGSDGEHVLDQVIDQKANALPSALRRGFKHTVKSRLRSRFSVQKTAMIPAEELANACNFVAAYVFDGEFFAREKHDGLSMSLQDWINACPVTRHAQAGQPVGRVILTGALCADMDTVKPLQRLINQLAKQGVDVSAYEAHYHFLLEYLRENRRFLRDAQRLMDKASENEFAFRTRVAA